ncbi:MAG: thiamine phosphate synthase [Eubacteriaceae bacterium]|nr:thiamine phosphate synthase [Eubacteriaceae bacterium]
MLICVTNQKLCNDDFLNRIHLIAQGKPQAIMLREKELSMTDYEMLAIKVNKICAQNEVSLIINQNVETALKMNLENVQLSMDDLRKSEKEIREFEQIGASVHSVNDAKEAEKLGATYLIAGHIFPTDCKKGIAPRGLSFLKEVCDSVKIPVFAIGGITKDKLENVLNTGAKGVCIMSEAMTCLKPIELAGDYRILKKELILETKK